jgi:CheY-like chemotaxis protein
MRVLVLDEDDAVREALRLLLEDAGHLVLDVTDAPAALGVLRACADPCAALFDVPPRTGRHNASFFTCVAAEPALAARHAYVCMTTNVARLDPALRRELAAYHVPVLAKPFDVDVLLRTLVQMAAYLPRPHALVR